MGTNSVSIKICDCVADAPDYVNNGEGFKSAELSKAIVVRNGTQNGNDTVDLQFVDGEGNKFVAMVTARILKSIADVTITNRN